MAFRTLSLACLLALLIDTAAVARPLPACLATCTPGNRANSDCCVTEPALVAPCADYKRCRRDASATYADCIASNPACRPSADGRCTLLVERCAQTCQFARDIEFRRCENQLTGDADTCSIAGHRQKRFAARVCRKCKSVQPSASTTTTSTTQTTTTVTTTTATTLAGSSTTTTTTVTTTTNTTQPAPEAPTEGNLKACILRLESVRDCYGRCDDRCDGLPAAIALCQEGCRNDSCNAIRARCATVDGGSITPDVDRTYFRSCNAKDNCRDKSDSPCKVTTTTESTTTTTTTSTTTSSGATTTTTLV